MSFDKYELNKPLDPKVVKSRSMSGRNLSYVEAWYVIDRLNQVFGFDGWERETLKMDVVQQEEKENSNGKSLYYVGYVAKVRVSVNVSAEETVYREGTGFGQGQDADLGRAHESAVKEAESDAMKRAAMTFGYQFGLALYDKTQEHVEAPKRDEQDIAQSPVAQAAHHLKTVLKCKPDRARELWKSALTTAGNPEDACALILGAKNTTSLDSELKGKELHTAALEVVGGNGDGTGGTQQ